MNYLLYKPYGYISQFTCDVKKKKLLGELYDFAPGTMAVGRLDEDSEGLLLLTTDGKLSERIRNGNIEKEYYALVDRIITDEAIEQMQNGVEISLKKEKYFTKPCIVKRIENEPDFPERSRKIRDMRHGPVSWVSVTLTEGKLRQVRKMTAAVGFPTLRLVRIRIGKIILPSGIQPGNVVELSDSFEV